MIENIEFISSFVEEATGHINNLETGLLNVDTGNPDMEAINDLFRAVHSIKGTAGFFNLNNIVNVSHCMENVFDECRNGNRKLTDNDVDSLLTAIDCLKEMTADVMNSEEYDASHVINTLKAMPGKKTEPFGLSVEDSSETKACDTCTETRPEAEPSIVNRTSSLAVEDSVRVGVSLLNNLLNLASEMVLSRNQLLRNLEPHRRNISGIDPILQSIDLITTQLQETIMQTRMQPVANVFNKFPRIIRELSKKLDKEIELCIEGADVEMDKTIIESLADPLTHLIRNSADHGLESSAERLSAGKPPAGQIKIKAYHEGGYVNIDIIDDGRGIDIEKVKQKAVEKGLIDRNDLDDCSEREILQFLFRPGFSTKTDITDMSGRGVGLDVVKTNIEKLGGSIEIYASPGNGTTIRLLLPLTLAIIPSLIVEVENQKFALPQANLQEIVRIKPGDVSRRIEYIHNSEVLRLRGRLLPIVHLATVLGLKRTYIDPVSGERKEERRKTLYDQRRKSSENFACRRTGYSNIVRIIVLKIGSRRFGIAVDVIHGSEEILVKALPKYVSECECYSGVTIMGDGKIAMILDPEGIVQKAGLRFTDEMEDKSEIDLDQMYESMREQQNLLIFRASGEEYLSIDLS
ncbi:MAG TPA: chemotaxis protein CheA, partial [Clostridia bacterium]